MRLGAVDFFRKPLNFDELVRSVRNGIRQGRTELPSPMRLAALDRLQHGARALANLVRWDAPGAWLTDSGQFFQTVIDVLADVVGVEIVSLMLVQEGEGTLRIAQAKGLEPEVQRQATCRIGEGIAGGVAQAGEPVLIRDLAPEAATLEGYLFPSTYRLTRLMPAEQICRQMTGQFRRVWQELGAPAGAHRLVTLASLVEKETAVAAERPVIASVFRNRLAIGMKLDCDPTTIYAALLENRYRGAIFQSDLASASRYNTYKHAGLPPGPIANPGKRALEAALAPAETKFLYFVARPDQTGMHQFSVDLDQHQRAVAQYRRGNQKANSARPAAPLH
jgi:cell division protein YceG involved in septum cleavage